MKLIIVFLSVICFNSDPVWLTDFKQAQQIATEKNEYILLNFSGSDWCGPCMRMRKEIFQSAAFDTYAGSHLVLVNADFPRSKKNQLSKDIQTSNDALAEKYNHEGKFPYTLLLTSTGKLVKEWEGLPDATPDEFVKQIMSVSGNSN